MEFDSSGIGFRIIIRSLSPFEGKSWRLVFKSSPQRREDLRAPRKRLIGVDWRKAQTDWQALRLNQPLIAFENPKHPGALGKIFSLVKVGNPRVRILAVKKAEQGNELIVRIAEMDGRPAENIPAAFAGPIAGAREVNGQEMRAPQVSQDLV